MVGNVSNNQNAINTNNNVEKTSRTNRHAHVHKLNGDGNNPVQKPDAISGATKKSGGDHYFDTKA